ncbi:MAG: type II toxin-antitoxin system prevent-host-death family antitoxin [Terracidiphilus sp.]
MPGKRDKHNAPVAAALRPVEELRRWKLEQAKTRFSEVVRLAAMEGPQLVTIHEREAAVVMVVEDYRNMASTPKDDVPLVDFLQGLGLADRNVYRGGGGGERDVEL